jgi:hypothetical protein
LGRPIIGPVDACLAWRSLCRTGMATRIIVPHGPIDAGAGTDLIDDRLCVDQTNATPSADRWQRPLRRRFGVTADTWLGANDSESKPKA